MTPKPSVTGAFGDEAPSEDDRARERLGPRGVPGEADLPRMTPPRGKKTPPLRDVPPEHPK
jgi:hypothetical protein